MRVTANKFLQSDQTMLSCLLQKAQKSRQHVLAAEGRRYAQLDVADMPTVLIIGPYRFFFYSSDGDEPPHVHVKRDDCAAKYWIEPLRID